MGTKRRRIVSVLAALFGVSAFFILSSIAVVWANGLRFNPETRRFEQTVVIAVESDRDREGVEVYLNGEQVAQEVPFQLRGLVPGHYELLLREVGFQPYTLTFNLGPGEVKLIRDYQPIAVNPLVTVDPERVVFVEPAFETGLRITSDGELLDRDRLVTRLIDDPIIARRFNTGYIYQLGAELRFYLPDGPHDYLIYQLSSNLPARINTRPGSWEIVVQEGETVKVISLTKPTN